MIKVRCAIPARVVDRIIESLLLPFVLQSVFNKPRKVPKRGSHRDVQFEHDGFPAILFDLRNNAFGLL